MPLLKFKHTGKKLASRYFYNTGHKLRQEDRSYTKLSAETIKKINKIRLYAIIQAGIVGIIGGFLYFYPYNVYKQWFLKSAFTVPYIENKISLSTIVLLIGLVGIEIFFLFIINLRAIKKIAIACDYSSNEDNKEHINSLILLGIERNENTLETIGLNPYEGLKKIQITSFSALQLFKAAISSYIIRFSFKQILPKTVAQVAIDLTSLPAYAFWNAYTIWVITQEAKIRIIAPDTILDFLKVLKKETANYEEEFKKNIYDILQFIVLAKRTYHYNLYFLAVETLHTFDIEVKSNHDINIENEIKKLSRLPKKQKHSCVKLILFGMLIDGSLSKREIKFIEELNKREITNIPIKTLKLWEQQFNAGKGIEGLINYKG